MPGCRHRLQSVGLCLRRCNHVRSYHDRPEPLEQAALIDPKDLRGTLDNIRAANRTRRIRSGTRRLVLTDILDLPRHELSEDAQAIERVDRAQEPTRTKSKRALRKAKSKQKRREPVEVYTGKLAQLVAPWKIKDKEKLNHRHRTPWLKHLPNDHADVERSSHERLLDEIEAFSAFMSPNIAEQSVVTNIFTRFQGALQGFDPEVEAELVGSRASGLASPLSDLDINLRLQGQERFDTVEGRQNALDLLRKVRKRLYGKQYTRTFSSILFLTRPRVPILRTTHVPSGLSIDIQCTNGALNGLEYAKHHQREYSSVKDVFFIVRAALRMRGLDVGDHGGLTSYPLLNMIVAARQSLEFKQTYIDPASHLLEFLNLFSSVDFSSHGLTVTPFKVVHLGTDEGRDLLKRFDRSHYLGQLFEAVRDHDDAEVLRVRPGISFTPREMDRLRSWAFTGRMLLQDPADPDNNLGRTFHRVLDFQTTVRAWNKWLRAEMVGWDARREQIEETGNGHVNASETSLLGSFLKADWKQFMLRRDLLSTAASQTAFRIRTGRTVPLQVETDPIDNPVT